jgi:ATP-dependent Clp endopeptidase proteolytic subunit ClpP
MILNPPSRLRFPAIFAAPPTIYRCEVKTINSWLRVVRGEAKNDPVELLIYDQIGKDWWDGSGVQAKDFADVLKEIPRDQEIIVGINSPGGNVFDGLAIYNQLEARHKYVTMRNDGLAASIASIIFMAGKRRITPENALVMIHDPWGGCIGNAADMEKMASELHKVADSMAGVYANRTGKTKAALRSLMLAETWFDGNEARAEGFADEVTDPAALAASIQKFDLSGFRRVPASARSNRNNPAGTPSGAEDQDTIMKELIALLKKHGVTAKEGATLTELLAELDKLVTAGKVTKEERDAAASAAQTTPAPAAPATPAPAAPATPAPATPAPQANVVSVEEFQAMQRQVAAERTRRITADLDQIVAANPSIDRAAWLPRALADESILATLRAMPIPAPGAEPIRPIQNNGNSLVEQYRGMRAGAERRTFAIANYDNLLAQRRRLNPRAANTVDSALITDFLADAVVTVANNKLAALAGFSRDFGTDRFKPTAQVQVKLALSTGAAQTNPTNFETGDTTLDNIAVAVNQVSRSFHVSNNDLNGGVRLANLAEINANTFVNAISDVWTALILDATYAAPGATNVGAAANFDSGTLADIYGVAKNFRMKNLILDGAYVGRIVSQINPNAFKNAPQGDRGAFGFDLLAEQNRWTSADANTVGIACGPDAIAVASGLPLELPAEEFMSQGTADVGGLGLVVAIQTWFARGSRATWSSFDVMFGAAAGDTTQLSRLKSA